MDQPPGDGDQPGHAVRRPQTAPPAPLCAREGGEPTEAEEETARAGVTRRVQGAVEPAPRRAAGRPRAAAITFDAYMFDKTPHRTTLRTKKSVRRSGGWSVPVSFRQHGNGSGSRTAPQPLSLG